MDIVSDSDFHGGRTIFFDRSCTPKDFSDDDEDFFVDAFFGTSSGADLFCLFLEFGVISATPIGLATL